MAINGEQSQDDLDCRIIRNIFKAGFIIELKVVKNKQTPQNICIE